MMLSSKHASDRSLEKWLRFVLKHNSILLFTFPSGKEEEAAKWAREEKEAQRRLEENRLRMEEEAARLRHEEEERKREENTSNESTDVSALRFPFPPLPPLIWPGRELRLPTGPEALAL